MELKCYDAQDVYKGSSTSLVGDIGTWVSAEYCGSRSFMTGVRFRSKDPSASLDETAGNNIDASCDNGQTLYGNGLYWGEWSDWVYCPANTAICGTKTRGSVTLLREAFKRKETFGKGGEQSPGSWIRGCL